MNDYIGLHIVFITEQDSVLFRVEVEAEETVENLKRIRELC
jgi:hypothetical protein